MSNYKEIHIGQMMEKRVTESGIEISRICNFMKNTEEEIQSMYQSKSVDTEILLKWSKLLEYDFFRIYTQHLILYAPPSAIQLKQKTANKANVLPQFRKNIYTKEIIEFILEELYSGNKTKKQIIEEYRIPKTTLYKWISKYESSKVI